MTLVFMGTAPFAVPSLRALVDAGHTIAAVVTQPDRAHGRGLRQRESAVKQAARALNLPLLQPERTSHPDFVEALHALSPAAIVVIAYGQILRPAVLDIPPRGCINVHGSLLPELRGAAPIQWSILRGCARTGVTTMFMDVGMDTGDVLLTAETAIHTDDTAGTLAERLAPIGAELLVETLRQLQAGTLVRRTQDSTRATYAPMLKREDGALRWDLPAAEVRNRIHGCNPTPGAYARRGETVIKLWRAAIVPDGSGPAGTVLGTSPLTVATADGALCLMEVQPESRGRMAGEAFALGYRVQRGEIWLPGELM